jgi:hypothetical protein
MAMKRVIAYCMHEIELSQARQSMPAGQATDSYIIGDIDETQIPALEASGILVEPLAAPPPPQTPGVLFETATVARGARRRRPEVLDAGETVPGTGPDYYLVELDGPLIEGWRDALAHAGADLLEYVPQNAYTAHLTLPQVASVSALSFVRGVRRYGQRDAGPIMGFEAAAAAPGTGTSLAMLTFDARLHREADRVGVLAWMKSQNLPVAGASRRKIRFYALEGSSTPDQVAALPEVAAVEEYVTPQLHNDVARGLLGVDAMAGNPAAGLGLTGQGQIVAVADTGLDDQHPDFAGRILGVSPLGRAGDASDPNGHGTHVAGSVLGDGNASGGGLKGVAPQAKLFFQSLLDARGGLGGLPLDLGDLFEEAYQQGARVHNNSWGSATASLYTLNSSEVDEFVAARRDMLIVVSAGNEGTASNPAHSQRGFVDWLSIGSPASAKNAIVVGASRSTRTAGGYASRTYGELWPDDYPDAPASSDAVSGNPDALAAFSSRGPCDDRRVKPDVVAPGTDIASTKSSRAPLNHFWGAYPGNPKYAFMGGTSMAAPLVAGCAALVREYYAGHGVADASAALVKATLINGTRWLSGADAIADHPACPNYHQGFGCIDLRSTLPNATAPALRLEARDPWRAPAQQFIRTGQRFRYAFSVAGNLPLRICLAWTDLPARGTQNSLTFMLQGPGNQRWVANTGLKDALTVPDPDNNVHVVRLDTPPAGQYLLQVFARNLLKGPQDYALVVSGDLTGPMTDVP